MIDDIDEKNDRTQAGLASSEQRRSPVEGLISLPPLPHRSQELLQLLTDPDLEILTLVELIEQSPALAARILGVANSPFFKSPMPVRNIADAIIRLLGLRLVRDLSLSLVLSQPFDLRHCHRFEPLRYWRHAMSTAMLAQMLAPQVSSMEPPSASDAYLGGLLHSLGILALAHVAPEAMNAVLEEAAAHPEHSLCQIERDLFDLDHAAVGGELALAWHLPHPLFVVMRHHRDPDYQEDEWPLARVVMIADRVSKARVAEAPVHEVAALGTGLIELGIQAPAWERTLERWRERVSNIESIASTLASRAP